MAVLRLLLLLSTVLTRVSSSPVLPPDAQRRDADLVLPGVPRDGVVELFATSSINDGVTRPPVRPGITKITASIETSLALNPHAQRDAPAATALALNAVPTDAIGLAPLPIEPQKGCTTTISESYKYLCSWAGTQTVYPATTILYKQVNCNGCDSVYVYKDFYTCPNQVINKTERAATPSTFWSTICRPTPALDRRAEGGAPAPATTDNRVIGQTPAPVPAPIITASPEPASPKDLRSPRDGNQPNACPTTLVLQPEQSAGKVSTKYSRTTTTTLLVPCSGCSLSVSTALAGYGPPALFTSTTTLPVGTVTTYACRP
ncbi:hypothetical protein QBC35DRAFT_113081 [Podospora australis]|uniref:Uncharacterized protein n=1 Tax=Podospora australis TaxID=1536484 RepID=A0AAN7ACC4_9PEZI|nr:hypothetical protein QBC35DRAFT_113081 [Podospora australis]